MNLLYLTPSYPPMIGGGERYAQALAEQAIAAGHKVTVVTSDISKSDEFWQWKPSRRKEPSCTTAESVAYGSGQQGDIQVIRCPSVGVPGNWPGLLLWRKAMTMLSRLPGDPSSVLEAMARRIPTLPALRRVLDQLGDYDLVHGFNLSWENALIAGWHYAREHELPFVLTPFAHLGTADDKRIARNNTMAHQLVVMRDADAVLALTSVEREGLIDLGMDSARIFSVGSGFRPAANLKDDDKTLAAMESHGLADPLVLFVGRISRDKGAIHASEAIQLIRKEGDLAPNLALVGAVGRDYESYHQRLSEIDQSHIRIIGLVDEATKQALFDRSRMLVLPSRVDSFGIVLLEAWSHSKPVIGARAGGIPGVIDEGVNGLLVNWGQTRDLANAISSLLRNPEMAERMGEAGRIKAAREFTWPAVYGRVERVYQGLMHDNLPEPEIPGA